MKHNLALAMGVNLSAISWEETIPKKRVQYNKNRLLVSFVLNKEASQQILEEFRDDLLMMNNSQENQLMEAVKFSQNAVERMEICSDYTQDVSYKLH